MTPSSIGGFFLLILLAILAPTPIPVPLDGIVVGLIAKGFDPMLVIIVTLIGDLLGTFLIFKIGNKSRDFIEKHNQKKKRKPAREANPDKTKAGPVPSEEEKKPFDFGGLPDRDLKKNLGCG